MATELRNIPANTIVDGVKYIGEFGYIYQLQDYLRDPETGGKIVTDQTNKILTYDITADSTASDTGPGVGIILNSIYIDDDNQEIWSNSSIFLPNGSVVNQKSQFKKTENGLVYIGNDDSYFCVAYGLSVGSSSGEPGPDPECTTIARGATTEEALKIDTTNSSNGKTESISLPYPSDIDASKTEATIVLDVALDKKMSEHNSDKTAHQDIRDLIAKGSDGVTIDKSIPETPLDTNVPSTKLLSTELDKKLDNPRFDNNPIYIGAGIVDQSLEQGRNILIGHNIKAYGTGHGIVVGYGSSSWESSIVIGESSKAFSGEENPNADSSIIIGNGSNTFESGCILIGNGSGLNSKNGIIIGNDAGHSSTGENIIIISNDESGATSGDRSIVIGGTIAGDESISIGNQSNSQDNAVVIGNRASGEVGSIAIGYGSYAKSGEIAIGNNAVIDNFNVGARPEILLKSKNIDFAISSNNLIIDATPAIVNIDLSYAGWLFNHESMGYPAKLNVTDTQTTVASSGEVIDITYPGTGETDPNFLSLSIDTVGNQYDHTFELVTKESIDTTTVPETPADTQIPSTKLMVIELAKKLNALSVQDLSSLKLGEDADLINVINNFNALIDLLTAASQS